MPDVGRLRWVLTADTRGFEAGMARARRSLARIGRLATAVGAGAGIGAIQTGLRTADAIGKIARAAGVSTDEIQQLRFALQEAGGTAGELDQALLRFNRRLGELATTHQGQLASFLRRTNTGLFLQLKAANSTTEAFLALSDAARAMPDARSRQALVSAAFGRPSVGLSNLLLQGRGGIRAAMGRLPAGELVTEELIREAERTNDEILRLTERATLQVSRAALEVVRFVQDIRRAWPFGRGGAAGIPNAENPLASPFGTVRALNTIEFLRRSFIGRLFD